MTSYVLYMIDRRTDDIKRINLRRYPSRVPPDMIQINIFCFSEYI